MNKEDKKLKSGVYDPCDTLADAVFDITVEDNRCFISASSNDDGYYNWIAELDLSSDEIQVLLKVQNQLDEQKQKLEDCKEQRYWHKLQNQKEREEEKNKPLTDEQIRSEKFIRNFKINIDWSKISPSDKS